MDVDQLCQILRRGSLREIEAALDAGADIHYVRPHGYDAMIDVACGRWDELLVPVIKILISRCVHLNGESSYSESALSVLSRRGEWEAIRVLLDAGAAPERLQWTPLMHEIALGTEAQVQSCLQNKPDLSARDFWSRTPWLLSLQSGDTAKAKLILAAGADLADRGRHEKPSLFYPVESRDPHMLCWLLSLGISPDITDKSGETALMEAAQNGATECAKVLLDAGADISLTEFGKTAIERAANMDIVRLLVSRGADLNDISEEMRAALTKIPFDGKINVSKEDYQLARSRRFGTTNPEKMNIPFWRSMITSGAIAYKAREHFGDQTGDEPVWCFHRFGKSITEIPDGRIIEIAGEHEDFYDEDFCIYNDVIVHNGNGTFDIYGYPEACFPPTDFHSATLVGKHIYIIGNCGYPKDRRPGETPVYRLNIDSFEIEKVETTGNGPGWIGRHKAELISDGKIRIRGGMRFTTNAGAVDYEPNPQVHLLDLQTNVWTLMK